MSTALACPHCGKRYQMQAEWAGKKLKCRACGQSFRVPAPAQNAPLALGAQDLADDLKPLGAGLPLDGIKPLTLVDPFAASAPTILTPVGSWHKRRAWLRRLKIGGLVVGVVAVLAGVIVGGVFLVKAAWQNMPSFTSIPGESFAKEVLRFANDVVDVMASIKDAQSAQAAVPKLKAIKSRALELAKQLEEVKKIKLTPEQNREMENRYRPQMEALAERMKNEVERVQRIPGIYEALADAEFGGFGSSLGPALPFRFPSFARSSRPGMTPFSGPRSASSSPPPEDELQKLTRECGPDKILTVSVEGVPGEQTSFVYAKVREAAGARGVVRTPSPGTVTVTVGPVGDVQAVAKRIDFGQVTQVDPVGRKLAVKADPGKFPEPIKPEATNPTHPDYVKANLAELKCPDPDRRGQAASRLRRADVKQDRDEVAKALVTLMSDNDPSTRREAMGAWAACQTSATTADATAVLLKLLADQDVLVRAGAWEALGSVKEDERAVAAVAKMLLDKTTRGEAASCLAKMGPAAEKPLLEYLKHNDKDVQREAARVLAQVATRQSTPALLEHLEGPDADLAKASLQILAKLKDPKAIEPVAHLLGNKALAGEAARMLIETGPAAEKAVIAVAKSGDKEALSGAMTVLDKIGTAECIPVVIQAAAGGDTQASWAAFRILERVKDERSIVPMAELLVSIHHRHHAANVLKAIGPPAEDVMLKGLKLRDTQVVRECLGILGAIGTEKSLRPIKAIRSRDRWVLDSARQAYAAIAARSGFAQGGFDTDGGSAPAEPEAGAKDPLMKGGFDTGPVEKGTKSGATGVE